MMNPRLPIGGRGNCANFSRSLGLLWTISGAGRRGCAAFTTCCIHRAGLLPHLARWIGWDLDLADEISQRMEILFAPELYRKVGTLPNLEALVNRVTGWNCRIKEYVHNVCLSNAPETLHLWDIWGISRNSAGKAWLRPVQYSKAENYDGRPAGACDAAGDLWLFWHSSRSDGCGIWCQNPDVSGTVPHRIELYQQDDTGSLLQNAGAPSVIAVDKELWLFCEAGQPGKREIWWTPVLPGSIDNETPDKACSYPARNLSLHPADDSNPAAALGNQVWVFWQSNRPTDIWARVHKDSGDRGRITTAGIRHWAPAAVVDNNNTLWLFCEDYYSEEGLVPGRGA